MTSISKLESEIAKLKAQLKSVEEKELSKAARRGGLARLKSEKRGLKRALHPGRAKFSDFMKLKLSELSKRKGEAQTSFFKRASKLAKKEFQKQKKGPIRELKEGL